VTESRFAAQARCSTDHRRSAPMTSDAKAATAGIALAAASTCAFPFVTGYGTILSQIVVLGAWSLVASATSGTFADHHHGPVWAVALALNLIAYGVPLAALRFCTNRARTEVRLGTTLAWTAFYIAALFVLFPATDGP
jgi:hypothetical protein